MQTLAALLLIAPGLTLAGGLAALALGQSFRACLAARFFMLPASVLGLGAAVAALWQGATVTTSLPFALPIGHCIFMLDPLAAAFLIPIFLLSALASLIMPKRVRYFEDQAHMGRHAFFFCLLSSGMALVVQAGDGLFFLLLWEIMSLAPFFLLTHSDRSSHERFASWIYLTAAHLGALPLLLLFCALTLQAGDSSFAAYMVQPAWQQATLLFVLALAGFGTKAGIFPMHMWMPEAHSSAPGHVAVLLSGTMLNVGLYGIMRVLCLFGGSIDWAYILMGAGALSGVMGILAGLVQTDMKRTLAYSSAENMGIILLGLGGALLAARHNAPIAMALLLCGMFFHIWNHSVFKSLLFLAANAVKEGTHVTTLQRLGGLQKKIPLTGGCFAAGSAAIAGAPPFNGFMGELLLYMGFVLGAAATRGTEATLVFWLAFFCLGAIAGFALFAFARVYGLAFLGAPRSPESMEAREPDRLFRFAMVFLAVLCLALSLAGPALLELVTPLLTWFAERLGLPLDASGLDLTATRNVLGGYAAACLLLCALFGLFALLRRGAVRRNGSATAGTWGCGYTQPSARMQYSGGSFALTAALLLKPLVRANLELPKMDGLFPSPVRAVLTTPDWPTTVWQRLIFRPVAQVAEWAKDLQHGLLNIYILYILVALVAALVWALGVSA